MVNLARPVVMGLWKTENRQIRSFNKPDHPEIWRLCRRFQKWQKILNCTTMKSRCIHISAVNCKLTRWHTMWLLQFIN